MLRITLLTASQAHAYLDNLVDLLRDAVDGGASVSFLPPLDPAEARAYWTATLAEVADGTRLLLAAFEDDCLAGSVQLELAQRPNGRHRGEVAKLLVHSRERRRGIGAALMGAVEDQARALGRTTLVLDTRQGDLAEGLYRRLGWTEAGVIPRYALNGDGGVDPTVVFYKLLEG